MYHYIFSWVRTQLIAEGLGFVGLMSEGLEKTEDPLTSELFLFWGILTRGLHSSGVMENRRLHTIIKLKCNI